MKLYNSQSKALVSLEPVAPGRVGIYCCGPTVYNYIHIGNARPFVVFDVLRRWLLSQGLAVTYVQNFTDIDDKMIKRANEEQTTVAEVGEKYIAAYFEDTKALNLMPADVHPRATEHIEEMLALIQTLVDKGLAYESGGDVYFSVKDFPQYGALSGQAIEDLESGARIEPGEGKRHPLDFALWKAQKPGEPAWDSPWGPGRPGWHIECSAMASKYLGETVDIHCGGEDLLFPHHENEVAQSTGATGKQFAKYWMHNAFLQVDHKKMSKSLGNFFTLHDILKEYSGGAVRMYLLSAHYRSPLQFSDGQLKQAQSALERITNFGQTLEHLAISNGDSPRLPEVGAVLLKAKQAFADAMDSDLNTADALAAVFEMIRELNPLLHAEPATLSGEECGEILETLKCFCDILGLPLKAEKTADSRVEEILEQRRVARQEKNWALSDQLRDELKELGFAVEDTPQGQKVKGV